MSSRDVHCPIFGAARCCHSAICNQVVIEPVVGWGIIPTRHEVIMELMVQFSLVEGVLLSIIDPDEGLPQCVRIVSVACAEFKPKAISCSPTSLTCIHHLQEFRVEAARHANGGTIVRTYVHDVHTVLPHEKVPKHHCKVRQLAGRDAHANHLRVAQSGVVIVAGLALGIHAVAASIACQRIIGGSISTQNRSLCGNELVLNMPETPRTKVDENGLVWCLGSSAAEGNEQKSREHGVEAECEFSTRATLTLGHSCV
mmetsp:Transcript_30526/g.70390  ORF Transcript_30526/g.70390 Transcript_30526/m.70390 type:complete len:256 (-) Transcript_30526:2-769(-)